MERAHSTGMRDLEQELADTLAAHRGAAGEPLPGLLTLTREMDADEDDQFDVDLTIQDFLTYKATESLFEWRASSNPYQSDLPDALLTMTAGTFLLLAPRIGWPRLFVHELEALSPRPCSSLLVPAPSRSRRVRLFGARLEKQAC